MEFCTHHCKIGKRTEYKFAKKCFSFDQEYPLHIPTFAFLLKKNDLHDLYSFRKKLSTNALLTQYDSKKEFSRKK